MHMCMHVYMQLPASKHEFIIVHDIRVYVYICNPHKNICLTHICMFAGVNTLCGRAFVQLDIGSCTRTRAYLCTHGRAYQKACISIYVCIRLAEAMNSRILLFLSLSICLSIYLSLICTSKYMCAYIYIHIHR